MIAIYIAAFVTGLAGSLHCAGMCGPLVLGIGMHGNGKSLRFAGWYNLARIASYMVLGIISGSIGAGLSLAGWQQDISIAAGILILISVFISGTIAAHITGAWTGKLQRAFGKVLRSASGMKPLYLGLLNGFLPCGLVYLGLAEALSSGTLFSGAVVMLSFGAGTLPMMFSFSAFGNYLGLKQRKHLLKWLPLFSVLVGCLLIMRGLGLGIPFISPAAEHTMANTSFSCPMHE